jgi:nicotinate (nicotinamide) nucleotide adenylyltransferase
MKKIKVGLYGGSFNPIHFGHMEVMNEVLERNLVDEVWLMPCRNHVFQKDLASIDDRLNMLELATSSMENVHIEDLEAKSRGESRTATSLKRLRKIHDDKEFYFIAGADTINDIDKWYDAAYIKKTTPFIIASRKGYALSKEILDKTGLKIEALVKVMNPVSSTDIRDRIFCGLSLKGLIPRDVEQYISMNGLYKKFQNPGATVDLIVPIDDGLLYAKRKYPPFKDYWTFPGGYLNYGAETLEEAGVRELWEETSLITKPTDLELLGVYSAPNRDPRGHIISHAYVITRFTGKPHANTDVAELRIFKDKPDRFAFDHLQMYDDYRVKYKA